MQRNLLILYGCLRFVFKMVSNIPFCVSCRILVFAPMPISSVKVQVDKMFLGKALHSGGPLYVLMWEPLHYVCGLHTMLVHALVSMHCICYIIMNIHNVDLDLWRFVIHVICYVIVNIHGVDGDSEWLGKWGSVIHLMCYIVMNIHYHEYSLCRRRQVKRPLWSISSPWTTRSLRFTSISDTSLCPITPPSSV